MSRKENGDEIAAAMAKKRWDKTPAKKRSEHAKMMIRARWDRYYAEHPDRNVQERERRRNCGGYGEEALGQDPGEEAERARQNDDSGALGPLLCRASRSECPGKRTATKLRRLWRRSAGTRPRRRSGASTPK